ncbi:MAG: hypothetical protein B6I23_01185 [Rickettsiaceae bacterium 4572_127]|nr:MAG: hypothetical protein B6I23_01185 [Rickettsiaceae bacterium 4572_127]
MDGAIDGITPLLETPALAELLFVGAVCLLDAVAVPPLEREDLARPDRADLRPDLAFVVVCEEEAEVVVPRPDLADVLVSFVESSCPRVERVFVDLVLPERADLFLELVVLSRDVVCCSALLLPDLALEVLLAFETLENT